MTFETYLRWKDGQLSRQTGQYSKYRYVLEARPTPDSQELIWCGAGPSIAYAWASRAQGRQDWAYQVWDAYLNKVVTP